MKKLIAMLLMLCMVMTGCLALGEGQTVCDAGRLSVTVPDGWNALALPETQVLMYQGEDLNLEGVYVSITYFPVGDMFWDIKEYYNDVQDLDPVTTGAYTWTAYNYSAENIAYTNAMVETAEGTIFVSMTRNDDVTIENADVQAMLSSIQVVPTVTADWFTLSEDGVLTVTLQGQEGYAWQDAGMAYSTPENDSDSPEYELIAGDEGDVYTATLKVTSGEWFTQYFSLSNDTAVAGQAIVTVTVADGKITAVTNASCDIYPEPQVFEMSYEDGGDAEDAGVETDYPFDGTTWESGDLKLASVYQDGYYKIAIQDGDTELSYLCDVGMNTNYKISIGTGVEEFDAEQADRGLAVFYINDNGDMVWKRATGDDVIFTWYSEATY